MAEYHAKVAISSGSPDAGHVMHAIYTGLASASNTAVRFATHGATTAVYAGSSLAFGNTPASDADWPDGAYMDIAPVAEYATGLGRWQCRIERNGATIWYRFSPGGGWLTTNLVFASSTPAGSSVIEWAPAASMNAATQVYVSTHSEAYNGGLNSYTYCRILIREGATACGAGLYVGGYIPFQPAVDTKPAVALGGIPDTASGTSTGWGYQTSGANNRNVVPTDYAHSAINQGTTASDCYVATVTEIQGGSGDDRAGRMVAPTLYLFSLDGHCLGVFGGQAMLGFDGTPGEWVADSDTNYVVTQKVAHKFTAV